VMIILEQHAQHSLVKAQHSVKSSTLCMHIHDSASKDLSWLLLFSVDRPIIAKNKCHHSAFNG
jgi:hypothetical protein